MKWNAVLDFWESRTGSAKLKKKNLRLHLSWKRVSGYTEEARKRLIEQKSQVDADIRDVESELTKVDPARRLDTLLKEISTADRYESYRGLTGRIHHDLRRLSDDLSAAREEWDGSGTPPLKSSPPFMPHDFSV